jgi:hypothetical protein
MRRVSGRRWWGAVAAGRRRVGLCGLLAVLYLVLAQSALTCALHHGLNGACPHMGAAMHGDMAHAGMAPGAMPASAPAAPLPVDGKVPGAHFSLCHCLDNLTAMAPALPVVKAVPAALPPLPSVPTAPAQGPAHGPAAPRGPPLLSA